MDDLSSLSDEQLDLAIASKLQSVEFDKLPKDTSEWSDDQIEAGIIAHRTANDQRLAAVQQKLTAESAAGSRTAEGGAGPYLMRQGLSAVRQPIIDSVYGAAVEKFNRGEADEGDLRNIAIYRHEQELAAQQSIPAKIAGTALSIPGQLYGLAKKPLTYFGVAGVAGAAAQLEKSPLSKEALGHGLADAALTLGVFKVLGPTAKKIFPNAESLAAKMGAEAITMPGVQQVADITGYMTGLKTRYGLLQEYNEGKYGELGISLFGQALLGAGAATLHHGPAAGRQFADKFAAEVEANAKKGMSATKAAESALTKVAEAAKQAPETAPKPEIAPEASPEAVPPEATLPAEGAPDAAGAKLERPLVEIRPPTERQLTETPEQAKPATSEEWLAKHKKDLAETQNPSQAAMLKREIAEIEKEIAEQPKPEPVVEPPRPPEPVAEAPKNLPAEELKRRFLEGEQVDVGQAFDAFKLNAKEKQVMQGRLEGLDLEVIGKKLGVTKQRIEQIEKAAMKKMGVKQSLNDLRAEQQAARKAEKIAQGQLVEPIDPTQFPAVKKSVIRAAKKSRAAERQLRKLTKELANAEDPEAQRRIHELLIQADREARGLPPATPEEIGKLLEIERPAKHNFAELNERAEWLLRLDNEAVAAHNQLISDAYAALKPLGVHPVNLHQVRRRGSDAANPAMKGFDDVAGAIARQYPELMGSGDVVKLTDRLFELLSEGKRKPLGRKEAFERAAGEMEESPKAKPDDVRVNPDGDLLDAEGNVLFGGFPVPKWATDWLFTNRQRGIEPPVTIDRSHPLPRLQSYGEMKAVASTPRGMGLAGAIGRLADPRANATDPVDRAIIARAYSQSIGESLASVWATSQQGKMTKADAKGMIELAGGGKGFMADVFEAELAKPGSQPLTPEQRAWLNNEYKPIQADFLEMMRSEGIKRFVDADGEPVELNEHYFPRTAIGKRAVETKAPPGSGQRPGGKIQQQKSRIYESEQAGVESSDSIIYDPDPVSRVAKMIRDGYRAVADTRLAKDVELGGKTPEERFRESKAQNKSLLQSLPKDDRIDMLRELRERANHPVWGREAFANVAPAFQGMIYPEAVARALSKAYGESSHDWIRKAESINSLSKALMLTGDMSAPFVQGLPIAFRNPKAWGKATAKSYQALLDPNVKQRYVEANRDVISEVVQLGGSFGHLPEFLSSMQQGNLATRIPVIGRFFEATGRAFGVFLDVAKIEDYKAHRDITPPEQRAALVEGIENSLLMGRMESIGMHPGRALGERLLALAPSYYRGFGGLVSTAFQRGVPGSVARKSLAAYSVGLTALSIAAMKAVGLTWDEVAERLNPSKGKFMKVPISLGDGTKMEVGLGNIVSGAIRLGGEAVEYLNSDKTIDTGVEGNPFLRFLRGKAAMLPRLGIDLATGRDFMGNQLPAKQSLARSFEPIVLQQLLHGQGTVSQRVGDAAATFFGAQSFSESSSAPYYRAIADEAKKRFGAQYSDLSVMEQARVVRDVKRSGTFAKPPATPAMIERAFANSIERQRSLTKAVSPESRAKLGELNKQLPGYDRSLSVDGIDVPMTEASVGRFEQLLAEEYNRTIAGWKVEQLRKSAPEPREDFMRSSLTKAKARARDRLIRESAAKRRQPAA